MYSFKHGLDVIRWILDVMTHNMNLMTQNRL